METLIKSYFSEFMQEDDVSTDIIKKLIEFYFLYSMYEVNILDKEEYKKGGRKSLSINLAKYEQLKNYFDDLFNFFQNRYYRKENLLLGLFNNHTKNRREYDKYLEFIEENDNLIFRLRIILIIIHRLRNNLFHGTKLSYNLNQQVELFSRVNNTLKLILKTQV